MIPRYKIEIRNSPEWRKFTAATLGVSVTSPNWQNDKLASILHFSESHFNSVRVDVSDALYRHGYIGNGMNAEEALARANSLGSLWLAQHADLLESVRVPLQIMRWADWYTHTDYGDTLNGFYRAYQDNDDLRQAVDNDVLGFFRRQKRTPNDTEYNSSRDYFIEELAIITIQARELSTLRIYPGDELHCFRVVRNGLIPEAPKGLEREQFAKIKFCARTAPRSQSTAISLKVA